MRKQVWTGSAVLLSTLAITAAALAGWKQATLAEAEAAFASQPAALEAVTAVRAASRQYQAHSAAIGTVLALRSVTLSNEVAGAVAEVFLQAGAIVEPGTVLVALDVAVEQAELKALRARAELAGSVLERLRQLHASRAVSREELERAEAEQEVALAEVERLRAVIERKTIRAPFRGRVGLADLHPGQYLEAGSALTTLQSVDDAVHVDFPLPQDLAARLEPGTPVRIQSADGEVWQAGIVAVDARIDAQTRNATVRARLEAAGQAPAPGASVRVEVPDGAPRALVSLPASALRRGPEGEHVFVLAASDDGQWRAQRRSVEGGALLEDEVLIRSGLRPGELVASEGSFKLRDNAAVAVDDSVHLARH